MALSKIAICNMSLAMLGADSIRSFDENNKRARMCEVFFEPLREDLLSKFDWPFARKFTTLHQRLDVTIPEGCYAYGLPADNIKVRDLHPKGGQDRWEILGPVLTCKKSSDVKIYYTANILDTAQFSPAFSNLLALTLAVTISPSITQDKKLTSELKEQLRLAMLESFESDANTGNDYRAYDEDPNNSTFVNPDGAVLIEEV